MTLLFLDGFDHYSTLNQKYEITPGGASIGSSYARTGSQGFNAFTNSAPTFKVVPAAAEHATFIAGIALKRTGVLGGAAAFLTFGSDSGTTFHVTLGVDAAGKLKVMRGPYNGTILGSESGATLGVLNTWHYVELKVTLSDTVGIVVVRVDANPTPVINLSAQDTKNGGTKTVFDAIGINGDTNGNVASDDLYLCNAAGSTNNDFLGDIKVETLLPNAEGSNSGMTCSTGTVHNTLVKEVPPNTSDYVFSAVDGTKDTWGYANTTQTGGVKGVQVNTYAQKSDAGAKSFRPVVRHGGTDYPGTDVGLGTGFGYYRQVYETNPGTGAAWTTSELDAAEFGAEARP